MRKRLEGKFIDELEAPTSGQLFVRDDALTGFGLRVTSAGTKTFIVEAKVNGRTVRVTIGKYPALTAQEARKRARAKLGEMSAGVNPNEEKRRQRIQSATLGEAVNYYLENKRKRGGKELKPRTKLDVRRHADKSFSDWLKKPLNTITPDMVRRKYRVLCKSSVAQANQAFRVLSGVINYAMKVHRADGVEVIASNPCEVLTHENLLHEVKPRTNAVPVDARGAWWAALEDMRADPGNYFATQSAADCVALLALTGLRSGEARAIKWDDVDLDAGTLRLTDTKNRTNLLLPLSAAAAEIINSRPRVNEYVFPNRARDGHLKDVRGPLAALAARTGVSVSPHDLRRTFIRTGWKDLRRDLYAIKKLSNHAVNKGDVSEVHYLDDAEDVTAYRADVEAIADYFKTEAAKVRAGNVVDLRARA